MIDIVYTKHDICMITESWLNNDITDLYLNIDGYSFFFGLTGTSVQLAKEKKVEYAWLWETTLLQKPWLA